MTDFLNQTFQDLGPVLLNILAAVAILIIGFILAKIIGSIIGKALSKTTLDERLSRILPGERPTTVGRLFSRGAYYIIILLAVISALQVLNLTIVTEPLNGFLDTIFAYIPKIIAALILTALAYIVATVVRILSHKGLESANLNSRWMQDDIEASKSSLATSVSTALYYLIFLLFLPGILGALDMRGILLPVEGLVDEILGFLPNLLAAALIILIGFFVAKLIRNIVSNLLAASGINRLSDRVGISSFMGTQQLSDVSGMVVYALVLLPVIVAGLNALEIDAVTGPASSMLDLVMASLPNMFAACIIMVIAYVVGQLLAGLVANLLSGFGLDRVLTSIGLTNTHNVSNQFASRLVGKLVLFGTMLFASMEASAVLGFETLSELISGFAVFAGQLALGLVIVVLGMFVANFAYRTIKQSHISNANVVASIARVAIIGLVAAMGLRQMGIANSIINLAFGLTLGSVAIAAAIAFGIGGRDFARNQLERLSTSWPTEDPSRKLNREQ